MWFMMLAVLSALAGMIWGIQMAATQDHSLAPAHGHLNLIGWVSCAIFAFYYHQVPQAAEGLLPRLHFLLVLAAILVLAPGIALAIAANFELLAMLGSLLALASMLLFGFIVLRPARVTAPG